jgi:hypothetical protein
MRRFDVGVAVCFAAMISGAVAQPVLDPKAMAKVMDSGNFMLPYCQHTVASTTSPQHPPNVWDGECTGIIKTLGFLGRVLPDPVKNCVPDNVVPGQGVRVVVKYMEAHPEKLHLNFTELAMSALAETWPCPN